MFDCSKTSGISCARLAIRAAAGGTPAVRSIRATRLADAPNNFASSIYNGRFGKHDGAAGGETTMPQVNQTAKENKIMAKKSKKSTRKKSPPKRKARSAAKRKK
jgi:hypothetical protein